MITLRDLLYLAMYVATIGLGYYIGYNDCKNMVLELIDEADKKRRKHKSR